MILHPHSAPCHWIQSHSRALLAVSWLLGGAFAYIPIANTYTTAFAVHGQQYYQCTFDNQFTALKRDLFGIAHFVLTFALPLAIMAFSYVSIMHALRRNAIMTSGVTVRTDGPTETMTTNTVLEQSPASSMRDSSDERKQVCLYGISSVCTNF